MIYVIDGKEITEDQLRSMIYRTEDRDREIYLEKEKRRQDYEEEMRERAEYRDEFLAAHDGAYLHCFNGALSLDLSCTKEDKATYYSYRAKRPMQTLFTINQMYLTDSERIKTMEWWDNLVTLSLGRRDNHDTIVVEKEDGSSFTVFHTDHLFMVGIGLCTNDPNYDRIKPY